MNDKLKADLEALVERWIEDSYYTPESKYQAYQCAQELREVLEQYE